MGDVPYPKAEGPTRSEVVYDRLAQATAQVLDLLSLALTGERRGSLRRPVYFILAAVGLVAGGFLAVIGLVAVMLLALTDRVPPA